jgi:putative endopeptidase
MTKTRTLKNRSKEEKEKRDKKKKAELCVDKDIMLFEDKLSKTPEYDTLSKIDNVEKRIIQKFKTPFSPSEIKPNNDFYTYINYGWLKETAKKSESNPDKEKYFVQVDNARLVQNKINYELIDIVKEYTSKNDTPLANNIRNLYQSLTKMSRKGTEKHIHDFITLYDDTMKHDTLWKFLARINLNEIISWACPLRWGVDPDEKNAKVYRHHINIPQLGVFDFKVYFSAFFEEKDPEEKKYVTLVKQKYLEYIEELFDATLGKGKHDLKASDVFDIECTILYTMGCHSIDKKTGDTEYYNVVKKGEALSKYHFNWEEFSHHLGCHETPDTFICGNVNYLKCMSDLLLEKWQTPQWKSYWFYIFLKQIIRFDEKWRHIHYNFHEKFLRGQQAVFPTDIYPVFGMSFCFNTWLSREYLDRNRDPQVIQYVKNMGHDLLTVYKRIIQRNKWLSPKTKKYALLKLERINLIVGEPEELRYDPPIHYDADDAWGNMKKLAVWKTKKFIELDGKPIIDIPTIDWSLFKLTGSQVYIANAFYSPLLNCIYIPVAYMQKPFVDLSKSHMYNLAYIGDTLAHEMSHSLDAMGSKFDYKGNMYDWWTKEDKAKYQIIINDIIKQYETFASYDGIKFDAAIGIGEDMADISAIAILEEYLRDLLVHSNEFAAIGSLYFQSFFIYFAIQQRQHVYKNAVKAQLKTNPHPMDKYRTNVPLSRLELFRSLYNVKKGDKMWWHSTSTIW